MGVRWKVECDLQNASMIVDGTYMIQSDSNRQVAAAPWPIQSGADLLENVLIEPLTREGVLAIPWVAGLATPPYSLNGGNVMISITFFSYGIIVPI